jgi:hypothetical protein
MENKESKENDNITPEVIGAGAGAGLGIAGSIATLSAVGTSGLSAAGITSGLAAFGGAVGGGMLAGIFVAAAPLAILSVGGFIGVRYFKKKLKSDKG